MPQDINIDVQHLTRVEGHGNIVVNVKEGRLEQCDWRVPEAPRFFEAMVRGRHYTEVARITSRICGICAIGHTLVSLKATEKALGIEISEQTRKLRTLLKHAENFDSHVVHVLFLAAPDLFDAPSVFPLVPTHPEVVKAALRLKRYGHEWGSMVAGRTTHPTTPIPGGFGRVPTVKEIRACLDKMHNEVLPDLTLILDTVLSVADKFPAFDRPTEYMATHSEDEYGLYDGCIQSILPDGDVKRYPVENFHSVTNEFVDPRSTAKYTRNRLASYMAGALARFNNNYEQLRPEAKTVADKLGLKPVCGNPYLNTAAQVVEIIHSAHEGIRLMEELLSEGVKAEPPAKPTRRNGEGAAVIEVPRGILFHSYTYDSDLMCTGGDCVIPTNQNHNNIQHDFEKLVPELLERDTPQGDMTLALEMLVRAYDPCISCSTHYLDVVYK